MLDANEKDALIFSGHGSTAGINHLVRALKINEITSSLKHGEVMTLK
jgi:hypothetical protein